MTRVWIIAVLGALVATAVLAQSSLLRKQYDSWQRANVYRRVGGLNEFTMNDALHKAAQGHAEYIEKNNMFGHLQIKAKLGFTGEDPAVRATNAGYQ